MHASLYCSVTMSGILLAPPLMSQPSHSLMNLGTRFLFWCTCLFLAPLVAMALTGLAAVNDGDPLLKQMAWIILAPSILIYLPRLGSANVGPDPEALIFTIAGCADFIPLSSPYLTPVL